MIRFGLSAAGFSSTQQLVERAQWAQTVGFSTFSVSDHLTAASPFITLQAVADATTTLRLGTLVLNNDLRHPALLAQEAATLDRLSGGRLELGLGAGWALGEYRRAGIIYDPAGVRVDRLAETVVALQALFAGQTVSTAGPHVRLHNHVLAPAPLQSPPPLLIGGNGTRLLGLAAQHANIVSFTGFSPDPEGSNVRTHFSRAGLADRVRLVQQGVRAAIRPVAPELNVLLQSLIITDDRDYLAQTMAMRHNQSPMELLSCPFLAFGTVEEICGQLLRQHDEHAITYITVFNQHADDAAQVIAALDELAVDSDPGTDPGGNHGS